MSQSIPRITSALSLGIKYHQTICVAKEASEILSLAKLVLSTLNLLPRVPHIGFALMVMVFIAYTSAALTKLYIVPESTKAVQHYTYSVFTGNSKSHNFFKQFLQNAQAPCKCKYQGNPRFSTYLQLHIYV